MGHEAGGGQARRIEARAMVGRFARVVVDWGLVGTDVDRLLGTSSGVAALALAEIVELDGDAELRMRLAIDIDAEVRRRFGTDSAREWMRAPQGHFAGASPLDLMLAGAHGARRVRRMLAEAA